MKYLITCLLLIISYPIIIDNQDLIITRPKIQIIPKLQIIPVVKTAKITCYNDYGTTASGEITRPGIVATSDRSIPMGTKVYIEGYGIMEIKDKTAKWIYNKKGLVFDIWDKDCDKSFGVKKLTYTLIK